MRYDDVRRILRESPEVTESLQWRDAIRHQIELLLQMPYNGKTLMLPNNGWLWLYRILGGRKF